MTGKIVWTGKEKTYLLDGKEVSEQEFHEAIKPSSSAGEVFAPRPGSWPLKSDGAGVHPAQIPAAMESARVKGVPIEFTADGQAIFTSARHRRAYCRLHGLHDRNGGYGDP